MATQQNPFQPAIDELEKDLIETERHKNALLSAINVLRGKAGLPPRPEGGGEANNPNIPRGDSPLTIRNDAFFGKRMGTAARTYLEMRHAAAGTTNPATPREIFDALKQGGFVFETKDDSVAIISLRNMLRKNTVMFQKLPNGTYGLASWYPDAKKPKFVIIDDDEEDTGTEKVETATDKKAAAVS
jgi:hypothetical protein